jgi:hypothetical protein
MVRRTTVPSRERRDKGCVRRGRVFETRLLARNFATHHCMLSVSPISLAVVCPVDGGDLLTSMSLSMGRLADSADRLECVLQWQRSHFTHPTNSNNVTLPNSSQCALGSNPPVLCLCLCWCGTCASSQQILDSSHVRLPLRQECNHPRRRACRFWKYVHSIGTRSAIVDIASSPISSRSTWPAQ